MSFDPDTFDDRLEAVTEAYDREATADLIDELLAHISTTDEAYPVEHSETVLNMLRRKRYFDLAAEAGESLIRSGRNDPVVRRLYSQALIERDDLISAIGALQSVVADTEDGERENREARGLLGRAYKQAYVDGGTRSDLREAATWYYSVYERDPQQLWHGMNTVAVLMRGRDDGIDLSGFPDAEATAEELLDVVEMRRRNGEATMWDYAIALEAGIALGRFDEAVPWARRYVNAQAADAFEFASTLRQFEEVWRLTPESEPGRWLLPMLRSAVLGREGGVLDFGPDASQVEALTDLTNDGRNEAVLGTEAFESAIWLKTGMEYGRSVAKITDTMGTPVGTAFVVDAGAVGRGVPGDLLLLTNAHVISPDLDEAALSEADARVTFDDGAETFTVTIEWSSPVAELDATLLRTKELLEGRLPVLVAGVLPRLNSRVYIIGHPSGRSLSYSIYDNQLLEISEPKLHYRTPTEGGSSGSPVFNRQWQLIGLHHKGDLRVIVAGRDDPQPANEGIMFSAIASKAAERAVGGRD